MKKMQQRFDEIAKYKKEKSLCKFCPCYEGCRNTLEDDYSCEDMYFAYIVLGKNFDSKKKKKILKFMTKALGICYNNKN